jgi:hypothetical protein
MNMACLMTMARASRTRVNSSQESAVITLLLHRFVLPNFSNRLDFDVGFLCLPFLLTSLDGKDIQEVFVVLAINQLVVTLLYFGFFGGNHIVEHLDPLLFVFLFLDLHPQIFF